MTTVKKIVIIGPESTGKSTLADQLARHYCTSFAPEYAREYIDELQRDYVEEDLSEIAKKQVSLEEKNLMEAKNDLFFCDTDLYVLKVWSEYKYHHCDLWTLQQIAQRKYDLYLLTYIDVPWQPDPQREHPEPAMREYFYRIYRDIVVHSGVPWADIRGDHETRMNQGIMAIKHYIKTVLDSPL